MHRAPVTEPATTFAHDGRLRASHAVCLRSATLEPAICARKEETDNESVSTTGRNFEESLVMRGDFFDTQAVPFGFYATSRHCIPRLSPRNSNSAKRLTMALQRTAPAVTVAAILRSGVSRDRKSTRLNSSHGGISRMPSSALEKKMRTSKASRQPKAFVARV